MTRRRSLHIGLNRVDPDQYGGWDGALSGCVNDAHAMRDVASGRGFEPEVLIDDAATIAAVRDRLNAAAIQLEAGDFFFLTYSGHGGQITDRTGDEPDSLDETWCLYDTELVDDSLFGALCTFKRGVRVFVMSDSCHSETVTRGPRLRTRAAERPGHRAKLAPLEATHAEFTKNRDVYAAQSTWWTPRSRMPSNADANVVLISGCQDPADITGRASQRRVHHRVPAGLEQRIPQWLSGSQGRHRRRSRQSGPDPGIFFYGRDVAGMLHRFR